MGQGFAFAVISQYPISCVEKGFFDGDDYEDDLLHVRAEASLHEVLVHEFEVDPIGVLACLIGVDELVKVGLEIGKHGVQQVDDLDAELHHLVLNVILPPRLIQLQNRPDTFQNVLFFCLKGYRLRVPPQLQPHFLQDRHQGPQTVGQVGIVLLFMPLKELYLLLEPDERLRNDTDDPLCCYLSEVVLQYLVDDVPDEANLADC